MSTHQRSRRSTRKAVHELIAAALHSIGTARLLQSWRPVRLARVAGALGHRVDSASDPEAARDPPARVLPDGNYDRPRAARNAQWPTPHARRPQHRSPHAGGPGARARKARWIHGERSAETMQRYRLYRPIKQLLGGGPRELELATKLWNLIKFKNEAG